VQVKKQSIEIEKERMNEIKIYESHLKKEAYIAEAPLLRTAPPQLLGSQVP
jgi:hypothetical protein